MVKTVYWVEKGDFLDGPYKTKKALNARIKELESYGIARAVSPITGVIEETRKKQTLPNWRK